MVDVNVLSARKLLTGKLMKYYRVTATLLSPLMVQQDRQSNAPETVDYLPGSTLRGAVAANHFRRGGSPEDEAFRVLFTERPISFPNLLPANNPNILPQVLPLTAISCKRQPGFLSEKRHGIGDRLVITAARRTLNRPLERDYLLCSYEGSNKKCRKGMERISGYWNGSFVDPLSQKVSTLFHRHTGIDRVTGTVAPAVFYTTQAIADFYKEEGRCNTDKEGAEQSRFRRQYLSGGLFLEDKQFGLLKPLLEETSLFAGADRTRGYGELKVSISEEDSPTFDLGSWDEKFKLRFQDLIGEQPEDGTYFSLKLDSHAILLDSFLRPSSDIEFRLPGIRQVLRVTQGQLVRGWQSVWGLAKPDDMALSMGSVFLFRYTGHDLEALEGALQGFINEGIGVRREEGCGRVSICDPFHLTEVM